MLKVLLKIKTRINKDYNLFSSIDATTYKKLTDKFLDIATEELELYEEESNIKNQWNKLLENLKI